jgi:hypothetical protein
MYLSTVEKLNFRKLTNWEATYIFGRRDAVPAHIQPCLHLPKSGASKSCYAFLQIRPASIPMLTKEIFSSLFEPASIDGKQSLN